MRGCVRSHFDLIILLRYSHVSFRERPDLIWWFSFLMLCLFSPHGCIFLPTCPPAHLVCIRQHSGLLAGRSNTFHLAPLWGSRLCFFGEISRWIVVTWFRRSPEDEYLWPFVTTVSLKFKFVHHFGLLPNSCKTNHIPSSSTALCV